MHFIILKQPGHFIGVCDLMQCSVMDFVFLHQQLTLDAYMRINILNILNFSHITHIDKYCSMALDRYVYIAVSCFVWNISTEL